MAINSNQQVQTNSQHQPSSGWIKFSILKVWYGFQMEGMVFGKHTMSSKPFEFGPIDQNSACRICHQSGKIRPAGFAINANSLTFNSSLLIVYSSPTSIMNISVVSLLNS